jgi:predicted RecB family nuclease
VKRITAQDLYNYTKCHHRVYLDTHGDPSERQEVNEFIKLLWEMGLQTERDYLARLGMTEVSDLQALSLDAAAQKTMTLMQQGVPLIYQGVIQSGNRLGRPDLLWRRDDASSRWGNFYYEAVDIKAGRGWEERQGKRTRFKHHYAYQILFYRDILTEVQDTAAAVGRIINVDGEVEEFDPGDFEINFRRAMTEVNQLVQGAETSEPVLSSSCAQCEWYRRCRQWVEVRQDPTCLFFVGKVKFDLKRVGLNDVAAIAKMNVEDHLKGAKKIPRQGEKSLKRMKNRARVKLAGRPEIRQGYRFPEAIKEIYFDIEDDPTQDLTYFYGVLIRTKGQADRFEYFMAKRPEEEESTVRRFWEFLARHQDAVIYVYSPKERSTLRRLMRCYQLDPLVFDNYVDREYDLYTDLIVKYSDWPTYSYGIKQIARQVGFDWRDNDPSGANSIAWYNDYRKEPAREDLLRRIVQYNEDDCRAMVAVKEYFIKHLS